MKSIVIFYFSGTGNTEIVANMIKDEFSNREYHVDIMKIEDVLNNNIELQLTKYDLIGIGAQVIAFDAPRIIYDFIHKLPKGDGKKVFIFRTAGGVAPQNYNASKSMMKKLRKKGYNVFHERLFSIASNWVTKFSDDAVRQLYEATKKKVGIMCKEVILGKERSLKTSVGLKILMGFIKFLSKLGLRFIGKDLAVNKDCKHCNICIKNCPTKSIYEKNGKIKFKLSCACCMRCIYSCPQHAINFRMYKFYTLSGGYNIKEILGQASSTNKESNGMIPKFLNKYINNDNL